MTMFDEPSEACASRQRHRGNRCDFSCHASYSGKSSVSEAMSIIRSASKLLGDAHRRGVPTVKPGRVGFASENWNGALSLFTSESESQQCLRPSSSSRRRAIRRGVTVTSSRLPRVGQTWPQPVHNDTAVTLRWLRARFAASQLVRD